MSDPPEIWEKIEQSVTCLVCRQTPGRLNSGDMCQDHWGDVVDALRRGFHVRVNPITWFQPEGMYQIDWGKK